MKRLVLAGAIAAALAGATGAHAGTLGNWLHGRPAPQPSQALQVQASSAEVQIQQLQETVRQLTGRIEDMNFQVLQMQEQLRKTQEDNEFRFQQLEKKPASGKKAELETPAGTQSNKEAAAAAASDPSATAAATPPADAAEPRTVEQAASAQIGEDSVGDTAGLPAAGQTMPANDPTIANQTAAPGAMPPANAPNEMANMKPGTLGSLIFNGDGRIVETTRNPADNSADTLPGVKPALPPSQGASKQTTATAPAATAQTAPAGAAATKPMEQASITPKASATGAAPTADQSYQQAYQSILSGNYSEAERGFKSYLDTFPGSQKAADASFWMGEAQYSQGHYNDSAKTFLNAFKTYGQSPKAPDILLKLGMSLAALDNKDTACATFREIPKRYPKAPKAVITKVASEQSRLSCPAG